MEADGTAEADCAAARPTTISRQAKGSETAFGNREMFMAAMTAGGIEAMEIVAGDLKPMGFYILGALSFEGVEIFAPVR